MPIANYTTQVPAMKSIGEIQGILVAHKAKAIYIEFDCDGKPINLRFIVSTRHGDLPFQLPANIDKLYTLLIKQRTRYSDTEVQKKIREQAERVGWRIIKDWVRAQMAFIETEMVTLEQVMLPYLQVNNKSLYEAMEEKKFYLTEGKTKED